MKTFLLPAAALLLAMSCDYEFRVDGLPTEPELFLECLPGYGDTTSIKIFAASPAASDRKDYDMSSASVSVSVNGKEAEIKKAEKYTGTLREGWLYTVFPFAPGDRISVHAVVSGIGPVHAETSIPERMSGSELAIDCKDATGADITVSLGPQASYDGFYGLTVSLKTSGHLPDGQYFESYTRMYPELSGDISEISSAFSDPNVDYIFRDNEYVVFWSGKARNYDKLTMAFRASAGIFPDYVETLSYECRLLHLSPELYRYFRALAGGMGDIISEGNMFLPPNYAYTNVSGGFGVLGGCAATHFSRQVEITPGDFRK